jgi:hypothetical protein
MKERIWIAIGVAFVAWMILGGLFLNGADDDGPREPETLDYVE